jgi:hypothetical protein
MNSTTGQAPYGPPSRWQQPGLSGTGKPESRAASAKRSAAKVDQRVSWPGYAFILVFLVVVFEGAIRKWVTPATTVPLILLRDLAALALVFYAWKRGNLGRFGMVTAVMTAWSCLVIGWSLLQVVAGLNSPVVFAIGLRFWLLYTWFAVAAAATLTEQDYRAAIRVAIVSLLLMAPLAVVQYYSPTGATINRQLDGDEDLVFVVVAGVVRTTGTFSFTSGYATFVTLVSPLVFGILGARKRSRMNWVFALAAFGGFMVASVVSGSRTAVLSAGMMLVAYLIGRLVFSKNRDKPAALIAVLLMLLMASVLVFVLSDAVTVTQQRFEDAAGGENFWLRLLAIFVGEPTVYKGITWIGHGLGAGSNLATSLRPGTENFGLAESEAGRILLEGGLLGYAFIALKVGVLFIAFFKSWMLARKQHSPFPLLMWLTLLLGIMTWPAIGQLSANGLLGLLLGFFLLMFRYPSGDFFPARGR